MSWCRSCRTCCCLAPLGRCPAPWLLRRCWQFMRCARWAGADANAGSSRGSSAGRHMMQGSGGTGGGWACDGFSVSAPAWPAPAQHTSSRTTNTHTYTSARRLAAHCDCHTSMHLRRVKRCLQPFSPCVPCMLRSSSGLAVARRCCRPFPRCLAGLPHCCSRCRPSRSW